MKHTFIISISDGDCCYKYPLTIPDGDKIAIRDIYLSLCKKYDVEPKEGIHYPTDACIRKRLNIES